MQTALKFYIPLTKSGSSFEIEAPDKEDCAFREPVGLSLLLTGGLVLSTSNGVLWVS